MTAPHPLSKTCRVMVTPSASGPWNMAVDDVLLAAATQGIGPTLRFYSWETATLSLGYFQRFGDAPALTTKGVLPVVRRFSGGGAIVHEREITYALAIPKTLGWFDKPDAVTSFYRQVHEAISRALQRVGIPTKLRAPECPPSSADAESFYCFLRAAPGDLLYQGHKVGGSAQRRRGGALLQHGSLILAASSRLPEVAGLGLHEDLKNVFDRLVPILADAILAQLQVRGLSDELQPEEIEQTHHLTQSKYGCAAWTHRR